MYRREEVDTAYVFGSLHIGNSVTMNLIAHLPDT
jgi:hypothetical protein